MEIILRFKSISSFLWKCVASAIFLIMIPGAHAQDLEPRAYANAPVGLNFIVAGYGYSKGGIAVDPTLPFENSALEANTFTTSYARTLNVWDKSGKFSVTVPYACLSGSAELSGQSYERDVCGIGDPRFGF